MIPGGNQSKALFFFKFSGGVLEFSGMFLSFPAIFLSFPAVFLSFSPDSGKKTGDVLEFSPDSGKSYRILEKFTVFRQCSSIFRQVVVRKFFRARRTFDVSPGDLAILDPPLLISYIQHTHKHAHSPIPPHQALVNQHNIYIYILLHIPYIYIMASKSFLVVFGIMIMLAISQLGGVESRALRSTIIADEGCDQGANSMGTTTQFAVASSDNNGAAESSIRSLLFKLASGPSKRGPGH